MAKARKEEAMKAAREKAEAEKAEAEKAEASRVAAEKASRNDDMSGNIALALEMGKKEWGRSKIMIVGEGRAGKSAFANTIIGRSFTDTESTVGINQLTCDIKYASIGSGNGWAECEKPKKELESAVASMIANGINPDKERRSKPEKSSHLGSLKEDGGSENSAVETFDFRSKLKKVDPEGLKKGKKAVSTSKGGKQFNSSVAVSSEVASETTVGKYMDENLGGSIDHDRVEISEKEAQSFDNDLIMKCLADKIQTESKFMISVFDFGGQSVFNVSVMPTNVELYIFLKCVCTGYSSLLSDSLWCLYCCFQYGGRYCE